MEAPKEQREDELGSIIKCTMGSHPGSPLLRLEAHLRLNCYLLNFLISDLTTLSFNNNEKLKQGLEQGKGMVLSKDASRVLLSLAMLMEKSAKLGAALVTVQDEMNRRNQ